LTGSIEDIEQASIIVDFDLLSVTVLNGRIVNFYRCEMLVFM
jgi:hypothetical protein